METIGIIGMGTIGNALADGLYRAGASVEIRGTRSRGDNRALVRGTQLVLLCVKPQQVPAVLDEIAAELSPEHTVVSLCAGIPLGMLHEALPRTPQIARAMPNLPCEIGAGMTALCFTSDASAAMRERVTTLFEYVGRVLLIDERHFDAVTAVSGCGPAYACVIVEALTDGAVKQGLPRAAARELVAQTLLGAASMVLGTEHHPAAIRDRVTTPAGCTIDALTVLEEGGVRSALIAAVETAALKSRALCARVPAGVPSGR